MILILGSIIGVQVGQKVGQYLESSELKSLLALLLLSVGFAMAYDAFFRNGSESLISKKNINTSLNDFSEFILNLSNDFPIVYGLLSIILAITLGVLASFVRKLLSDYKKKIKVSA